MFKLGKLGKVGSKTAIQRAISLLRSFGTNAHVYIPGIGMLNGLQAANYIDSAGTQAGVVDQPVGLDLDAMGGLGVELVTNGDFSDGVTGWWAVGATQAIVSGEIEVAAATSGGRTEQGIALVAGKTYRATGVARRGTTSAAAVSVKVIRGDPGGYASVAYKETIATANAHILFIFVAPAADAIIQLQHVGEALGTAYFDNISVREISGIHASQQTTANKGVLRLVGSSYRWVFDATDSLQITFPAGYESATIIDAAPTGQVTLQGQNIVGSYAIGPNLTTSGRIVLKNAPTASELALLQTLANKLSGL